MKLLTFTIIWNLYGTILSKSTNASNLIERLNTLLPQQVRIEGFFVKRIALKIPLKVQTNWIVLWNKLQTVLWI